MLLAIACCLKVPLLLVVALAIVLFHLTIMIWMTRVRPFDIISSFSEPARQYGQSNWIPGRASACSHQPLCCYNNIICSGFWKQIKPSDSEEFHVHRFCSILLILSLLYCKSAWLSHKKISVLFRFNPLACGWLRYVHNWGNSIWSSGTGQRWGESCFGKSTIQ